MRSRLLLIVLLYIVAFANWQTQAGTIGPELESALLSEQGDSVGVIVTFSKQVDLSRFQTGTRSHRRSRLNRALRAQAAISQRSFRKFLVNGGAKRIKSIWLINSMSAQVPVNFVEDIAKYPGVESVKLDIAIELPEIVPSELPEAQWNIDAIGARALWDIGFTGQGVVVGVMDTGVDMAHPDLVDKYRGGTNSWFDPHGEHSTPFDAVGHGTMVTGVVLGGTAGGTAIGVAPDAEWVAVKIFDDAEIGHISDIHLGFGWMLDPDDDPNTDDAPDIINNSWILNNVVNSCINEFLVDIQALKAAGISVVFSAGNTGPLSASSSSPANYAESFSVGAVNIDAVISLFGARGPSPCHSGIFPNIVAPGVNIRTSDLSFGGSANYANVNGTSFSAPHASGAIALLISAFPDVSVSQIEQAIEASAVDLGAAGDDFTYGYGLIDVAAAYELLLSLPDTCPTDGVVPEPTLIIDDGDDVTVEDGTWFVSAGANPYGDESLYSSDAGDTYSFQWARNGENEVSLWWTTRLSRSTRVRVDVSDSTGVIDTVYVNQLVDGGKWNVIGTYNFVDFGRVTIYSTGGGTTTSADAVKFESTLPAQPDRVEIIGPAMVGENSMNAYMLELILTDGSSEAVTASLWDEDSDDATIDSGGVLTTGEVTADETFNVTAEYTESGCVFSDSKAVTIKDGPFVSEVIIDNLDAGASSTGTWVSSVASGFFEKDSVYSKNSGDSFTFESALTGTYELSLWWTVRSSRSSNVTVQIWDGATLLDTCGVDQKIDGGQWNLCGKYNFTGSAKVVIVASGGGTTTSADAVRFTPAAMVVETIVDNDDAGTTEVGQWSLSAGTDSFGSDSLFSRRSGDSYTFGASIMGDAVVYMWWTIRLSRSTQVTVEILDGDTVIDTKVVNQRVSGGRWFRLGHYTFAGTGKVRILSQSSTLTTCADAVRFME